MELPESTPDFKKFDGHFETPNVVMEEMKEAVIKVKTNKLKANKIICSMLPPNSTAPLAVGDKKEETLSLHK